MVLKGNLLFNGDFEAGTTEGWINGIFGLTGGLDLSISSEAKYKGNYGLLISSSEPYKASYIGYSKYFPFEEYEAYLYSFFGQLVNGNVFYGMVYMLDDKGNFDYGCCNGYVIEGGKWEEVCVLIKQFNGQTHFAIGGYFEGGSSGSKFYFDEAKLIGIRSIKSITLRDVELINNLTADKTRYVNLSIFGYGKVFSDVWVRDVSGTSPTLDINLTLYNHHPAGNRLEISHSQFTNTGSERISAEVTDCRLIKVDYIIGGTDPSFSLYHLLTIIPK